MSSKILYTKYTLTSDSAQNWQTNNPVLPANLMGFDTDNKRIKIGDGITAWNNLDFEGVRSFVSTNSNSGTADSVVISNYFTTNSSIVTCVGDIFTVAVTGEESASTENVYLNTGDKWILISGASGNSQAAIAALQEDVSELQTSKADKAVTLEGYGITDAYTKTEVDAKIVNVYTYKGSIATYTELPTEDVQAGWVYNVVGEAVVGDTTYPAGTNFAYKDDGTWDALGGSIDLSEYATASDITELEAALADKVDKTEDGRLITNAEAAKLAAIAEGATKVGTSETNGNILINDVEQTVYTLPTATGTLLGGVKSSTDANKIAVGTDGVMEVNSLDVQKLFVAEGDELILNGGTSADFNV